MKIDDQNIAVRDVVCGPTSTAIIMSNNTAFTFGKNQNGQLGHGHRNDVLTPTLLNTPDSSPLHHDQISKIKLGANFSAIVDTNGDLYTCGYNGITLSEGIGCLGQGYVPEDYLDSPKLVESLVEDGCTVDQVSLGNAHMVVLTTEGEVLTCGSSQWGRVGNLDTEDQLYLEPVEMLESEKDICQIESGKDFSMALTKADGIIYSWGKNEKGQCGTGSGLSVEMYAMEPMPVPVEGMLEGRKVVKISAGQAHAAALTDKGELFVWGMGVHHQPDLITDLVHTNIVDVQCGNDCTFAIDDEGKLYAFGNTKTGVLGLGKQTKALTPTLVDGLVDKKVSLLSAGWNHVACLI
jgi:alpha-tubulin suppressor-like RCC1 family protein